jgi:hypothetical protein
VADPCIAHPYEAAESICRSCGGAYCADCLIYPFGADKPPLCIPCAITAGGVRRTAKSVTRAAPKEKKQRLKEWRKAKKRHLNAPAPDGVATWQRMDEADADYEDGAEHLVGAEREALRLPPAEPEAPEPPPDVNFAPPAPAGTDWRREIDAAGTNFGAPASSYDLPRVAAENDSWAPPPIVADPEPRPAAYGAEPFEPQPLSTFEPPATFEPAGEPVSETWDPVAAFEPQPLEVSMPVTVDVSADPLAPSFGAPLPPQPEPLSDFGMDAMGEAPLESPPPPPPPFAEPEAPPPPVDPLAAAPVVPPTAVTPPMPPPPPVVRPATPTRVPAASTEPGAGQDAKDLLARIAELRKDAD